MPNPEYLFSDSDALIQLFIAKQAALLSSIRARYGTTLAITPEVESEISLHQKFRNTYEQPLVRVINSGLVIVADEDCIRQLLKARGNSKELIAHTVAEIHSKSELYHKHVDLGEAYSHALCVTLNLPLMSHDKHAMDILQFNGLPIASPTIRFADLLLFGRKVGAISHDECVKARNQLDGAKEYLPAQLTKRNMPVEEWDAIDFRIRSVAAEPTQKASKTLYLIEPS